MKAISKEELLKRIKERYPEEEFEIINYTTMSNPFEIKCLKCGRILKYPQAKNFLAKNKKAGCSDCNGLYLKNKNNINKLLEKYDIIKQERDSSSKMWYTCKCKNCGRVSTHLLNSFLENSCRCENGGNYWTEQELKDYLKKEYDGEYELISPFKTVNDKALFRHNCGFIWSTIPGRILYNKNGCPKCCMKQSKGCKIVEKQLKNLNLLYEKEKMLENSLQRFDFYLEYNNKKYAIEYNGKQHYEYIPFLHGRDIKIFEKYKERDKRKAQYCKDHDIKLIIIPHTFTNDEIKIYINNLFSSPTTS